jgi:hypothetical protein
MTTTTGSRNRKARVVVIAGRVLNDDQRQGRACVYCRVGVGDLDPVPAPAAIDGVMFLAAHRRCIDHDKVGAARRALARH